MLLHLLLNRSYPTACRKQALQHTATTDHGSRNLCTYRPATPSPCPPTRSVLTERSVKAQLVGLCRMDWPDHSCSFASLFRCYGASNSYQFSCAKLAPDYR